MKPVYIMLVLGIIGIFSMSGIFVFKNQDKSIEIFDD